MHTKIYAFRRVLVLFNPWFSLQQQTRLLLSSYLGRVSVLIRPGLALTSAPRGTGPVEILAT